MRQALEAGDRFSPSFISPFNPGSISDSHQKFPSSPPSLLLHIPHPTRPVDKADKVESIIGREGEIGALRTKSRGRASQDSSSLSFTTLTRIVRRA